MLLITGAAGFIGSSFARVAQKMGYRAVILDSLSYAGNFENIAELVDNEKLIFIKGDIGDRALVTKLFEQYQFAGALNFAAESHVDNSITGPTKFAETNIMGTQNLIDVCQDLSVPVKRMIAISTDKAVYPVNLYGSTKLTMEKMVLAANNTTGRFKKHFGVVRYGNVAGSRGSVIHRFREQYQKNKKVKITNPAMTRFWISQRDAVDLVMNSLYDSYLGLERRLFIPDMPAYDIVSLAKAVCGSRVKIETVGTRIGEKLHETILTKEEKELYGFEVSETSYVAPKLSVRKLRNLIKRDVDDLL